MTLTTIKLLGKLGQRFVREITLDISSVAEALKALAANFPDFPSHLGETHEQGIGYRIVVRNKQQSHQFGDKKLAGALNNTDYPLSQTDNSKFDPLISEPCLGWRDLSEAEIEPPLAFLNYELRITNYELIIVPAIYGSGGKIASIFMIIAGVVLIAFTGGTGALIGASLILTGISRLLTPTPSSLEDEKNKKSFVFNGPVNTTDQGRPVQLCYGRLIIGSQVISAGISLDKIEGEEEDED